MNRLHVSTRTIPLLFLLTGAVVVGLEYVWRAGPNVSLLLALSFWVTVTEGCIALAAAAELSRARWVVPIKKDLLSVYPMLLVIALLFLLLWPQIDIYPWVHDQGFWLNTKFFMLRNSGLLLVVYWLARKFATEVRTDGPEKNRYAALYLLVFVTSQTLIAFDWVMSLEYPWFSALFGAYFFIEAIYAGTAVSGIICYVLRKDAVASNPTSFQKTLKDVATLILAFSLMVAGFFFAQFLTIWYGNLPEEVSYIVHRVSVTPFRELSILALVLIFFIPFPVLMSARVKTNPFLVLLIACVVLSGIFVERSVFLIPVVPLRVGVLIVEFLLMGFLFVQFCTRRDPVGP